MFDEANSYPLDDPGAQVLAPQPPPASQPPASQPPPQRPSEPFIPSRADRPYHQWGQPDFALQGAMNYPGFYRGPLMPQMNDFAQLIHSAVMGLGRFGSRYTGMPAIAMGTYASAYWKAYQAGMHQRAGEAYQQYRMARQMTIDRGKEEMLEYAKIYATYYKDGKITDVNGFSHDMWIAAKKYQNDSIINQIESGNLGAVERILGATDSHIMNLIKGQHQEERQKRLDAEREEDRRRINEERDLRIKKMKEGDELPPDWRNPPKESKTIPEDEDTDTGKTRTTDDDDTDTDTDTESATKEEPTNEGPTTTGQAPVRVAQAGGTPIINGAPPKPAGAPAVNPLVKESADELVRSGKMPVGVPKGAVPIVGTEAAKQKVALNDLMSKGLTGSNENADLDAIRKINPRIAEDVQAMGHYGKLVPTGGENLYANMENLVRKVYPHWDPAIYKWIDDFRSSSKPEQKMLQSIGSIKGAAEAVFDALKDIDPKSSPIKNWFDYEKGRALTGDARWANVGQAFYDYIVRSLMAQNGGYKPQVTQIKSEMERFPITMGPRAIMAMMQATAKGSLAIVDTALDLYQDTTHLPRENTPGYNPRNVEWLRALADLDYNTGYTKNRVPVPKDMEPYLGPAGSNIKASPTTGAPKIPADAPSGSKIMYDKNTGKPWVVYPDKSIHEISQ